MEANKASVILESISHSGNSQIEKHGCEYKFIKLLRPIERGYLIKIESIKTNQLFLVKLEKDYNFIVKLK